MQRTFLFSAIEDRTRKSDTVLASIGVSEWRRAVIWLMQLHPQSSLENGIARLDLSFAAAARWLANSKQWQHLHGDRSNLHRAIEAWAREGCAHTLSRPTRILVHVGRLSDWVYQQQECREIAWHEPAEKQDVEPAEIKDVAACGRVWPRVAASVSDRVSDNINKQKNSLTHSLTQTPPHAATAGHKLPRLPQECWRANLSDQVLYGLLRSYWSEHSDADGLAAVEADTLAGAVLATRAAERTDPQRYCERCVELGVREHWLDRARDWRRRQRRRCEQPSRV